MSVSAKVRLILVIISTLCAMSHASSTAELGNGSGVLFGTDARMSLSGVVVMATNPDYLARVLTGTMRGSEINGVAMQRTMSLDDGYTSGSTQIASRWTWTTSIPEPPTLALFGTGVLSLGGVIRRKLV
jgi:hypothetical protein